MATKETPIQPLLIGLPEAAKRLGISDNSNRSQTTSRSPTVVTGTANTPRERRHDPTVAPPTGLPAGTLGQTGSAQIAGCAYGGSDYVSASLMISRISSS